jgi:hypothetical protein
MVSLSLQDRSVSGFRTRIGALVGRCREHFAMIGAAIRVANAAETGRPPSAGDLRILGIRNLPPIR